MKSSRNLVVTAVVGAAALAWAGEAEAFEPDNDASLVAYYCLDVDYWKVTATNRIGGTEAGNNGISFTTEPPLAGLGSGEGCLPGAGSALPPRDARRGAGVDSAAAVR